MDSVHEFDFAPDEALTAVVDLIVEGARIEFYIAQIQLIIFQQGGFTEQEITESGHTRQEYHALLQRRVQDTTRTRVIAENLPGFRQRTLLRAMQESRPAYEAALEEARQQHESTRIGREAARRQRGQAINTVLEDFTGDIGEEEVCRICFANFHGNGCQQPSTTRGLRCTCGPNSRPLYGRACITSWLEENETCPSCRNTIIQPAQMNGGSNPIRREPVTPAMRPRFMLRNANTLDTTSPTPAPARTLTYYRNQLTRLQDRRNILYARLRPEPTVDTTRSYFTHELIASYQNHAAVDPGAQPFQTLNTPIAELPNHHRPSLPAPGPDDDERAPTAPPLLLRLFLPGDPRSQMPYFQGPGLTDEEMRETMIAELSPRVEQRSRGVLDPEDWHWPEDFLSRRREEEEDDDEDDDDDDDDDDDEDDEDDQANEADDDDY